jgi:hypothetical protein
MTGPLYVVGTGRRDVPTRGAYSTPVIEEFTVPGTVVCNSTDVAERWMRYANLKQNDLNLCGRSRVHGSRSESCGLHVHVVVQPQTVDFDICSLLLRRGRVEVEDCRTLLGQIQ